MYRGKYSKRRGRGVKRSVLVVVCLFLVLTLGVLGTVAYLMTTADTLTNTFNLAQIPNEVIEDFDGETKSNVMIRNTSELDEPAYIRAAVVVNWVKVDEDGNATGEVYGSAPAVDTDYYVNWNLSDAGWVLGADGYYYYTQSVDAGETTDYLITSCGLADGADVPDGYVLSVTIAGQSIQADGTDSDGNRPVILAWGTDNGGCVSAVNSDASLTIVTE